MSQYANVRWSWYHGVIPRLDSEQLLADSAQDGAFLVRSSETVKDAHVLSVWHQQRIIHYRIVTDEDNMLILQTLRQGAGRSFTNLGELVAHYQGSKHGLCSSLIHPIELQDNDDDSDNDEEDDGIHGSIVTPNQGEDMVSTFLLHSLAKVHTEGVSNDYVTAVRDYLTTRVQKDVEGVSYKHTLPNLKALFQHRINSISPQVDSLKAELQVLQRVFDLAIGAKDMGSGAEKTETVAKDGYDSLPSKLRECSAALESLEKTAVVACKDFAVHVMGTRGIESRTSSLSVHTRPPNLLASSSSRDKRESRIEDVYTFDVTMDLTVGLQSSKRTLKVTMSEGILSIIKGGDEASAQVYYHHQVKQLINSRSKERRLGLLFAGQSRKDFNFETLKAREHFCQLMRLMKKTHQKGEESQDSITIFVGTFNMGDSSFSPGIDSWYQCHGWGLTMPRGQSTAHDIYAIGLQESPGDKDLIGKIKAHLRKIHSIDYEKVGAQTLWGIKLFVFVKPEHSDKISHVQGSQVRTGIGNALGNKGAVGISFTFASTSLCFINCHLTSGSEKMTRRNQNYHDILKGMSGLKQARQMGTFDLTNQFHHLFWFGDLNYRIDLPATNIVENARDKHYELLLFDDQLKKEIDNGKVFADFREEVINFPPTYRYYRGRRTVEDYDIMKPKGGNKVRINVPSYCDRVLWKSYPGTRVRCLSYGCTSDIMTSDHSPVFATFQLSNIAPYVAPTAGPSLLMSNKAEIVVKSCSASIMTTSKTQFYIEINSSCFEGVLKSSPNNLWKDPIGNTVRPSWEANDMPKDVFPVISDRQYLEMQHVLVSIRSSDSDEVHAECVLTLNGFVCTKPVTHQVHLIHQGRIVGDMEITYHAFIPGMKAAESSYVDMMDDELIYTQIDSLQASFQEKLQESHSKSRVSNDTSYPFRIPKPSQEDSGSSTNGGPRKPPVPYKKPSSSDILSSGNPVLSRQHSSSTENISIPPFPVKRTTVSPQPPHSYSYQAPSSPQTKTPPLPHKFSNPKPAPKTPPKNIRTLLNRHYLGHFAERLIDNGYDDIRFIHETTEEELQAVGIESHKDREMLLKAFRSGM